MPRRTARSISDGGRQELRSGRSMRPQRCCWCNRSMATTAPPVAATGTGARSVAELCLAARDASRALAALPTGTKDAALHAIGDALETRAAEILEANARDMEAGRANGLDAALLDRLALDEDRVKAMADGVRAIAALPDPVGELMD